MFFVKLAQEIFFNLIEIPGAKRVSQDGSTWEIWELNIRENKSKGAKDAKLRLGEGDIKIKAFEHKQDTDLHNSWYLHGTLETRSFVMPLLVVDLTGQKQKGKFLVGPCWWRRST